MGSGMGGGFSGNTSTANNGNGIGASSGHAKTASNGNEDFSDFQGSVGAGGSSGGGETNGGSAAPAPTAGNGGITNAKWRDVSSLVDLGGLSSNTDKKVGAPAVGK